MDFSLPPELVAVAEGVRAFVEREVDPVAERIEAEDRVPPDVLDKAAQLGLFGLAIPEEYGGLGLTMLGRCLVLEQLGRTHLGFTSIVGAHVGIGTVGIVELGRPALRDRLLPDMAAGRKIGAFALSEPNAGSDAAAIRTRAERRGDRWVLNGTKHFVTNGPIADVVTVIAVTDPTKGAGGGISAFVVEKGTPGFRVGRIQEKMGLRGSHIAELVFTDCEVPAENLLGEEGRGYAAAMRIISRGRVGLAARCVGTCQKLLELSTEYARQRRQFGRPIGEFQAVQFMLADMATETAAARALTYQVAWLVDQGRSFVKEGPMAKLFASEVLDRVADRAVQIHGGMGYVKDFPIERYYRDARINRIYEGTSEIQRLVIARELLKG